MDIVGGYTLRKRCYDEDFNAYSQEVCPPYPVFCDAMEMDWGGKRMHDNRPLLPFIFFCLLSYCVFFLARLDNFQIFIFVFFY